MIKVFAHGVCQINNKLNTDRSHYCPPLVSSSSASQTLNDSETDEVLHGVDPNEVFPSGTLPDTASESDSGISDETPASESPTVQSQDQSRTAVFQVVYDISDTDSTRHNGDVISIELGEGYSLNQNRFFSLDSL